MKKLIVTLTTTLACLAAFAQGKINFSNDSQHLVYYSTDAGNELRAADAALAGQGVSSTAMPAGVTLVAALYAGTSSGSLSLVSSTSFGATAGRWTSASTLTAAGIAGGSPAFFQVQVRDSAFASEAAALAGNSYGGESIIFQMTPGSGIAFNSIVNLASPSFSTFVNGGFDSSAFGGAGSHGAIKVHAIVPEPTTFALVGLGGAALLIFRRRK